MANEWLHLSFFSKEKDIYEINTATGPQVPIWKFVHQDRIKSAIVRCIAMEFGADVHGSQGTKP